MAKFDLAEIDRVLEFGIILFFAWFVSEHTLDTLRRATFDEPTAVLGKWIAFFVVLLIYYKLIRVHLTIRR